MMIYCDNRNTTSKVYPAMYIENVTELAFDDITPEDPDFASIQGVDKTLNLIGFPDLIKFLTDLYLPGLAEAGLISSKLSRSDMISSLDEDQGPFYYSPDRYFTHFLSVFIFLHHCFLMF